MWKFLPLFTHDCSSYTIIIDLIKIHTVMFWSFEDSEFNDISTQFETPVPDSIWDSVSGSDHELIVSHKPTRPQSYSSPVSIGLPNSNRLNTVTFGAKENSVPVTSISEKGLNLGLSSISFSISCHSRSYKHNRGYSTCTVTIEYCIRILYCSSYLPYVWVRWNLWWSYYILIL